MNFGINSVERIIKPIDIITATKIYICHRWKAKMHTLSGYCDILTMFFAAKCLNPNHDINSPKTPPAEYVKPICHGSNFINHCKAIELRKIPTPVQITPDRKIKYFLFTEGFILFNIISTIKINERAD